MTATGTSQENDVVDSTRREMIVGGAFLLAAATAFARKPRHHVDWLGTDKIADLVPDHFGDWSFAVASGIVMPPQDQLSNQLYTQTLTRTYTGPDGTEIMLLIACNASQDGVVEVHRPEVCYPAGGFKLLEVADHQTVLAPGISVPSRYIDAESPLRRERIIYWTRIGNDFPRKWSEQRWSVFRQNIAGDIPDGLLIRISSIKPDVTAATLDSFARELYAALGKKMQQALVGKL